MRGKNSIMAAGAPLVRPTCSERLDYEAELMFIVGKGGRHISEADALKHVFGYTVFNDGSVRDYQRMLLKSSWEILMFDVKSEIRISNLLSMW